MDVLIVGGGSAGLSAALAAHESGAKVAVLGKMRPTRSQTSMAQGGINAALGHVAPDSVEAHIADTMRSAHTLAEEAMVRRLCEKAPEAIAWLDGLGTPFSRLENGKVAQRRLGGASGKRACYAQDYTGLKILHTLYDSALKRGIEFLDEYYLLNFIVEENRVLGVTAIEMRSGEVKALGAKSVVIASGGYAGLYRGFTTNSTATTGDGVAAAIRAGCILSDLEFVQFHPTALKRSGILISESARGAGGKLLNSRGERFVDELKTRDEIAKAIWEQLESGEVVFLDIRHLGEAFIEENLPQERKLAKLYEGVDPVTDLIPIKPVAHYTMGGIDVDRGHMTKVKGLFAAGECANARVHGANRLGGNSLLETIVFGREAGENAVTFARQNGEATPKGSAQFEKDRAFVAAVPHFTNQIDFYEKRDFMGKIFYRNAGIVRDEMGLKGVLSAIRQMQRELPFMGIADKSREYNTNLIEFIEFGNMVELAEAALVCMISRNESRGAHQREDYPAEDDEKFAGVHSLSWKEAETLCNEFEGME
ncbi:FAD-dependent oxidoreductase [Hydrogenimonas urashimensis]|uniref:FAD-dependent oxidoreductase n=1 Tax=Hydrogenimonas urashimensis TaxID=2740515 RepID=UPI0019163423|nr:FAD-dependent oxidoreductase [Hydrogenimonas urashimensis]